MPEPARLIADRYEIRALLGRGSYGEVYEAVAHTAGGITRRVALKCLRDTLASDPKELAALRDEAKLASRLHHGSIAGVIDFGIAGGVPFLVLELVEGVSAAEAATRTRARGAEVPLGSALGVVLEAARALHYAHTLRDEHGRPLGIVHRDVKPSNLLVAWTGEVKLVDFGIALAHDRVRSTTASFAKGTVGYMSPEQLSGSPLDARTDVFALGCTLHALLRGASPAKSDRAIARLLAQQPLELDTSALPEDVGAIVVRALAPRITDRYQTAAELAEDLARALASRGLADTRAQLAGWLATVKTAGTPAPAPSPSTVTLPPSAVLARVGVTDTFDERPPARAPRPSSRPSKAKPAKTFGLALTLTMGVGLTVAFGAITTVARRRAPPDVPDVVTDSAPDAEPLASGTSAPPPPEEAPSTAVTSDAAPSPSVRRPPSPPPQSGWRSWFGSDGTAGTQCFCMTEGDLDARESLCRMLPEPSCACWRNWHENGQDVMCLVPYDRAAGYCPVVNRTAVADTPCTGFYLGKTPAEIGVWKCLTCTSSYPDGINGSACRGIDGATGRERAGKLRCERPAN